MSTTTRATMKHAAVYSAAAMAGRIIGFIMLPFYAHVLRGQGYAVIGMLDVGLGFLLSLLVYGLQGAIVRLYHDQKEAQRKLLVVSTGIILIGGATAALTVPLMFFSRPIASLLVDDANLSRLVILALLSFNLDMVGQAASSWLLVRSRSTQLALLSLLRLFLGLSLNIYLVLIKDMGLDGYFISALAVNAMSCLIFVGIALRDCGHGFDREIALTIRMLVLPMIPGSMASWAGRQVERIMAKGLINLESVGIMEMGYKFPVLISLLIVQPFMKSWDTRRFEIADKPGAAENISRMFTYFIFLISWVGLIMAVAIKPVLAILTPPEFHISYRIAQVEIMTVILQSAYYHLIFGLAYAKDSKTISNLRIVTSVLKIALSWFFISNWGIFGAAFSAAITALVALVSVFYYSQKRYRLDLEWAPLATLVLVGGGMFVWLNHWNVSATGTFDVINEQFLPWINSGLQHTFLGTWKSGKIVAALAERSELVSEIFIKVPWAALFILVLPVIHPSTRQKWMQQLRRRRA